MRPWLDQKPVATLNFHKRPTLQVVHGYPGIYIYPNEPSVFYMRPVVHGRQIRWRLKARTKSCAARERKRLLSQFADYKAGLGLNPFSSRLKE